MWPGWTRSLGLRVAGHRGLHGAGAVGGRDAGGHALGGLDRHREGGAHLGAVARHHGRQVQALAAFAGQRQADQAAAEARHEVDGFGRDVVGGQHQVALVLAVFLVDQDDHAAGAHVGDDVFDGGNRDMGVLMRRAFMHASRLGGEHALDVAGDQVDLQVDAAAGLEPAQRGVLHGVRNQVDADFGAVLHVGDAVDREADAVDGDRALVGQVLAQRAGRQHAQFPAFADRREPGDGADAVDVARDDVAAQPVVGAQGLFQVDGRRASARPAVLSSDSAEMSMVNWPFAGSTAVTVMQAPLSAMLSPRPTSSR